VKIV